MKPARFIFNSDYTTARITSQKELSVTIPNDFTVHAPTERYVIGRTSTVLDNADDIYSVYYTSDKYNYMSPGLQCNTIPSGSVSRSPAYGDSHEAVMCDVTVAGNQVTLEVYCYNINTFYDLRYIGYGQTITAHILTFKDPFSA